MSDATHDKMFTIFTKQITGTLQSGSTLILQLIFA